MSDIENCFEEMARALPAGAVRASGEKAWRVVLDGEEVTVVAGEEGGDLVAVVTIGSYSGVSEKDLLLEDALKANCFWDETRGATLSVNPATGDLTLADRRELETFGDGAALAEFLAGLAEVAHSWRAYVAGCTPRDAEESGPQPSGFPLGEAELMEFRV